jgi:anthranilate phosphoribosyltransferase
MTARPHGPLQESDDPLMRALAALSGGERLGEDLVRDALGVLMNGEALPTRAAALLMGLRVQGESGAELAGAARAMRAVMRRVELPATLAAIDTAGTGGGAVPTFNVSTAAAFVVAAAGVPIAKHGNRSYTSRCGSADVLEALGIDLTRAGDRVAHLLAHVGMAFLFAPAFHPAMRHVAPVRRELAIATIMNLVGPLVNPAQVRRQVIGVGDPERAPVVADALRRLDTEHALVVHGVVGMDEVAPHDDTLVWEVQRGALRTWTLNPATYRLDQPDLGALRGGEPADNAARIARLLERPADDPEGRAATILNAGLAVYVSGTVATPEEGIARAAGVLDAGRGAAVLAAFRRAAGISISE